MPCYNCDGTIVETPTTNTTTALPVNLRGGFGPMKVVLSAEAHELLTQPVAAGSAPALLRYHGGHLIDSGKAKVFTIYMGPMTFDTGDFDAFVKAIVEDGYYLSPDSADATPGAFQGSITLAQYPFGATVDDSQIQAWLAPFIASKGWHADAYTLFALIFPAGTTVTMQGSGSCSAFCGYHSSIPSKTAAATPIYYSVQNDTSCAGCHGNFTPNDSRMMVMAHEYGEWRSDPDGTGWYNDTSGMENGDECAWQLIRWGPAGRWAVQPLAVNGKGCYIGTYQVPVPVPPPPPPPVPAPTLTVSDVHFQVMPDGRPYVTALDPVTKRTWGGYLS